MNWIAFDEGSSFGTNGSESGIIRRDEELDSGARITLEEGCRHAPYSISCGIYGWMFHTRYFGSKDEANRGFDLMKAGLEDIVAIIFSINDSTLNAMSNVSSAIEAFVNRFE